MSFLFIINSVLAAEFTATLIVSNPVEHSEYIINVKDNKHYIVKLDGRALPLLADENTNITWMLNDREKSYREYGKEFAVLINPVIAMKLIPETLKAERKYVGTEKLIGYECDKYIYSLNADNKLRNWKNPAVEIWVSKKLNHFIKGILHQDGDAVLEFRNIKEGQIKDSLFIIPANYKKIEEAVRPSF